MHQGRSPWRGQPTRVRLTLAAIVAAFVVVTSWNLERQGYAQFYATAARSMSMSWRAFWFGAFDPSATVTMDKLAGFLVPQALAVRMFGLHPWSLALPQVVEGAVTVVACYIIGTRWRGTAVGLLAAGAAAATPLFASMFGHPMEDGLLTMSLACAFACWQAAVRSGRWAPLVWAGVFVGVGFQAKMAQAWLVLPALVLGTWLARGTSRRGRSVRAGALLAVAAVASLAWTVAIQLVPANQRPYVDGTTDDNMLTMVFGFNGVDRVLPGTVPGSLDVPASGGAQQAEAMGTNPTSGLFKLVGLADASQVGWLYPMGLAGIAVALVEDPAVRRRRRAVRAAVPEPGAPAAVPEPDAMLHRSTLAALVTWLVVVAGVLSVAQVPHTAYLAAVGVPLAVLVGAGLAGVLDRLRAGTPSARRWASAALGAQVAWSAYVVAGYGQVPGALVGAVVGVGFLATLVAVLGFRLVPPRATAAFVLVGVLLAPVVWTGLVLDPHDDGNSSDAYAGPRRGSPHDAGWASFAVPAPWRGRDPRQAPSMTALAATLLRDVPAPTGPVVLTDYWGDAAELVLAGGVDARAAGGFSGQVPVVTADQVAALVRAGDLPFALLHDQRTYLAGRTHRHLTAQVVQVDRTIRSLCRRVSASTWDQGHPAVGMSLYDCRR